MAVSEVPAANAVPSRLDYLLKRARIVKQSTEIEPPLQISNLMPDGQALFSDIEGESSLAVESAMKQTFYSILVGFRGKYGFSSSLMHLEILPDR
jgi:THO complex subunit 1